MMLQRINRSLQHIHNGKNTTPKAAIPRRAHETLPPRKPGTFSRWMELLPDSSRFFLKRCIKSFRLDISLRHTHPAGCCHLPCQILIAFRILLHFTRLLTDQATFLFALWLPEKEQTVIYDVFRCLFINIRPFSWVKELAGPSLCRQERQTKHHRNGYICRMVQPLTNNILQRCPRFLNLCCHRSTWQIVLQWLFFNIRIIFIGDVSINVDDQKIKCRPHKCQHLQLFSQVFTDTINATPTKSLFLPLGLKFLWRRRYRSETKRILCKHGAQDSLNDLYIRRSFCNNANVVFIHWGLPLYSRLPTSDSAGCVSLSTSQSGPQSV